MKIKWLGHACFLITTADGVRILTDPFEESVGYKAIDVEADIVSTSHDHFDHNHVKAVRGSFSHYSKPGAYSERGVDIKGTASFHDGQKGAKRGTNVIFTFRADGLSVSHLGDLGHVLTDEQVKDVGNVDILLLPVGGNYTIDSRQALEVANLLKPKVIIPMHFKTPVLDFPIDGVDKFLELAGGGEKAGAQEVEITADNIDKMPKVLVLEYE